jgi:hypothetical protein
MLDEIVSSSASFPAKLTLKKRVRKATIEKKKRKIKCVENHLKV